MAEGAKPDFIVKRRSRQEQGAKAEKCGAAWSNKFGGWSLRLDEGFTYEPKTYFYDLYRNEPPKERKDDTGW